MSKPALRPHKSVQTARLVGDTLLTLIAEVRDAFPTCLNCANYQEQYNFCNVWNGNPPPRIIVNACDRYIDAEAVPF